MSQINLEAVDVDGAVREAALEVSGDTRLSFLKKAGMTGGAVLSGGAILGILAPEAMAAGAPPSAFGKGDIGILNYALTLEYLERAFYEAAVAGGKIKRPELKKFLETTVRDEKAHVAALQKALGKHAVKKPNFNFDGIPKNEGKFAVVAEILENTGVHAYLGQVGNIKEKAYVGVAASIVTIEARHAGAIGLINAKGGGIAPSGPFDTGYTAKKVLAAVKATGFIVS